MGEFTLQQLPQLEGMCSVLYTSQVCTCVYLASVCSLVFLMAMVAMDVGRLIVDGMVRM